MYVSVGASSISGMQQGLDVMGLTLSLFDTAVWLHVWQWCRPNPTPAVFRSFCWGAWIIC